MEIYDHNAMRGEAPQPQKRSVLPILACVLAAVALLFSAAGFTVALLFRNDTAKAEETPLPMDTARVYASVRDCVAEVFGTGTVGSGVIYAIENGKTYVLTNNHVRSGADTIQVRFTERGEKTDARVLGYDEYHDIVLAETEGTYGTAAVAATALPPIGAPVLAVGNNLGYGIGPAEGVLARTNRMLRPESGDKRVPVYSVTAAINAGMSGGGLFDNSGRLLGISTYQTVSAQENGSSRPVEGTGHVVPFSIADKLARRMLRAESGGQVEKIDVRGNLYNQNGIDFNGLFFTAVWNSEGLTVDTVSAPPEGQTTGDRLEAGDIVLTIGDLILRQDTDFAAVFGECLRYDHTASGAGKALTIQVRRGEETRTVTYTYKRLTWE